MYITFTIYKVVASITIITFPEISRSPGRESLSQGFLYFITSSYFLMLLISYFLFVIVLFLYFLIFYFLF